MAAGDIIVAIKSADKVDGTDFLDATFFIPATIPETANIISVEAHPREQKDGTVTYDIVATAEATV